MTKHICFEKAFSIVFFPLQFFDLMEHLHFSEEDQLVIGFQHQIIGQWVDHIVFCLFQSDQVSYFFGSFYSDQADTEVRLEVDRL